MRLRSTGLGSTELEGRITGVKRVDNLVIFYTDIVKPVKWRARMGFQEEDLRKLLTEVIKPGNIRYILRSLFFRPKNVRRTENF